MAAPHSSVVAGLTALNQGDYHKAIAQLEAAIQNYNDPTTLVKVQMGLVIAYKNIRDERAIALCQTLSHHPDPQIQTWALRHLQELNRPSQQLKLTQVNQSDRTSSLKQNSATPATLSTGHYTQRLKKLQRLPQINLLPLWLLQAGTAIAFFWLIRELLQVFMGVTNDLLVNLPYLEPIQLFYRDPTQFVLVTLFILLSVSPWLLDGLLQVFYGLQPLSLDTLTSHSPEARQLLERYSQRQNWKVPQLRLLPISVPLALTYGNLPRNARIVVTQGLLEHLTANEIATIYATQLGHIAHKDFAIMSLIMAATQLPYTAYYQISQWSHKIPYFYLRFLAGVIANFAYVVWYLLCIPAVWLSQVRIYYSDRSSTEITGNPNGLTRALLKITQGVATDIQKQECLSWLLESWQLLVPINHHQAMTLSPCKTSTDFESVLTWDCCHPYRYWFSLNQTHPLVGDRLQRLADIAQNWSLKPELAFLRTSVDRSTFVPFLRQGAPFFCIILGLILGCLTWLIGAIGVWLRIPQLAWMFGDWFLILGFLPIGFSIGTFIRINSFFPDSNFSNSKFELLNFLSNPNMLPLNSQPLRLQGKLLGRRGISNWLVPVLILESDIGLIQLHQPLPKLVDTLLNNHSPLVGQYIVVTGWCRRGATLWLDLDTWHQTRSGRSYHPVWSTILACAAAIWGAYIILQGGTK
ncbi:M48 family metalloprotease [Gloeocapsopsis crepidinum LEGE 06123]|uniref:M48 family metalloprotease n=1 Tax=Gloeocapsopsis crepidinum LEGE 06123 TaxID=588587 RepID=A0ABR9UNW8_9CHRO|nr:M48 family metalloprotease [Gloeocapsopsis crepidinum]MBE9189979.1 M48 family metalloprotease [Gloeocapsopsis crepidinum LEGE 06123]